MSSPPQEESAKSAPEVVNGIPGLLGAVSAQSSTEAPESTTVTTEPPTTKQEPENGTKIDSPPPRQKPEPKLCGVCQTQPGKYKCPRPGCFMPYCSVACNKQHKENHPPDPIPPTPAPSAAATEPPKEDDPYSVLVEHAHVFERLFKKYPTLPSALERIQASTLPPSLSQQFSTSSIPGRRPQQQQPWTKDVGLRKGADALRKARTDPGDTGDGVREFCDLVLCLLSTRDKREKAMDMVREEVVSEERAVIERLLKEEAGGDSS
ncbi:protein HIT1, partial [Cladorrhinum sp. PSN259]